MSEARIVSRVGYCVDLVITIVYSGGGHFIIGIRRLGTAVATIVLLANGSRSNIVYAIFRMRDKI